MKTKIFYSVVSVIALVAIFLLPDVSIAQNFSIETKEIPSLPKSRGEARTQYKKDSLDRLAMTINNKCDTITIKLSNYDNTGNVGPNTMIMFTKDENIPYKWNLYQGKYKYDKEKFEEIRKRIIDILETTK